MRLIGAAEVAAILDPDTARGALLRAFQAGATVPLRHAHGLEAGAGAPMGALGAALLLMPAWSDRALGVKLVTVMPDNGARGLPAVHAQYLLFDRTTGAPLAVIDGEMLTVRRTAAASALASEYLSRPDSARLLMVGAGALAPHLIEAHCAVRPIRAVAIWNRTHATAEALAARLTRPGRPVAAVADLDRAVAEADIVSCATLSKAPLVRGALLRPGTHVDLVGGFRPDMREADDETVRRAAIHVDTRDGALAEAGDLTQPIAAGVIGPEAVRGDLADLCRGAIAGRRSAGEITLFKSVGTALEDLAAAVEVYDRMAGDR